MQRANKIIILMAVFVGSLFCSTASFAFESAFHGYVESRAIWRDTSGYQDGIMDDSQIVQWIQELQLDMEVKPEYPQGKPAVRFEKAFFRYRGAYDSVFDVTDEFNDVREESPDDYELGKRDLKWDQDLREAFADLVAENKYGTSRANLRVGKQIVQWGEADVFNLINIVNPNDYYNKAFFSNPEDLLAPLWMVRGDASFPGAGPINNFNVQLLYIPYFRPHVFGPFNAPYQLGAPYVDDTENTWFDDNSEFGVRLGAVTAGSSFYLYFFDGQQDGPAVDLTTLADGFLTLRHPDTQTFGFSFSHFVETGNFVFRGEGSLTTDKTFGDGEDFALGGPGYTEHDFYQILFGFDKTFSNVPIGTDSALITALQVYYANVDDWDENEAVGRTTPEDTWRVTLVLATDYVHGTISPSIFFLYDSEEALLASIGVTWSPDAKFYINLSSASVWGDEDGHGDYNPYIDTSAELALKVGYRW